MIARLGLCAWASAWTLACSATHPRAGPPRLASHDAFVEVERSHFTPGPSNSPAADQPRALRTSGNEDQARQIALSMVRALLRVDELALQELLAERITHALEGGQRARSEWIERCLKDARALAYGVVPEAEAIVDTDAIAVRSAALHHKDVPLPYGIDAGDLVVTLPPRALGRDAARPLPCLTGVYVRPGPSPRIVGVTR